MTTTDIVEERQLAVSWPVIEVFGPTIQGEGAEAGVPCYFVRLGGCDFRCSWCDSMFAVEPELVREHSERLSARAIAARVVALPGAADWIVLSGGNPALHDLGPLVDELHDLGYRVAVETQGSIWRNWLADVDRLTVSPKPPSSGMDTGRHLAQFQDFMNEVKFAATATRCLPAERVVLKIVAADDEDYEWAITTFNAFPLIPAFLSVCTPQDVPAVAFGKERLWLIEQISDRYRWLCERVAADPRAARVRVLPQLHVLAWGSARGV